MKKKISMKPTENGDKFPKFSMAGSRAKISESTLSYFILNSGLILPGNFDQF